MVASFSFYIIQSDFLLQNIFQCPHWILQTIRFCIYFALADFQIFSLYPTSPHSPLAVYRSVYVHLVYSGQYSFQLHLLLCNHLFVSLCIACRFYFYILAIFCSCRVMHCSFNTILWMTNDSKTMSGYMKGRGQRLPTIKGDLLKMYTQIQTEYKIISS